MPSQPWWCPAVVVPRSDLDLHPPLYHAVYRHHTSAYLLRHAVDRSLLSDIVLRSAVAPWVPVADIEPPVIAAAKMKRLDLHLGSQMRRNEYPGSKKMLGKMRTMAAQVTEDIAALHKSWRDEYQCRQEGGRFPSCVFHSVPEAGYIGTSQHLLTGSDSGHPLQLLQATCGAGAHQLATARHQSLCLPPPLFAVTSLTLVSAVLHSVAIQCSVGSALNNVVNPSTTIAHLTAALPSLQRLSVTADALAVGGHLRPHSSAHELFCHFVEDYHYAMQRYAGRISRPNAPTICTRAPAQLLPVRSTVQGLEDESTLVPSEASVKTLDWKDREAMRLILSTFPPIHSLDVDCIRLPNALLSWWPVTNLATRTMDVMVPTELSRPLLEGMADINSIEDAILLVEKTLDVTAVCGGAEHGGVVGPFSVHRSVSQWSSHVLNCLDFDEHGRSLAAEIACFPNMNVLKLDFEWAHWSRSWFPVALCSVGHRDGVIARLATLSSPVNSTRSRRVFYTYEHEYGRRVTSATEAVQTNGNTVALVGPDNMDPSSVRLPTRYLLRAHNCACDLIALLTDAAVLPSPSATSEKVNDSEGPGKMNDFKPETVHDQSKGLDERDSMPAAALLDVGSPKSDGGDRSKGSEHWAMPPRIGPTDAVRVFRSLTVQQQESLGMCVARQEYPAMLLNFLTLGWHTPHRKYRLTKPCVIDSHCEMLTALLEFFNKLVMRRDKQCAI